MIYPMSFQYNYTLLTSCGNMSHAPTSLIWVRFPSTFKGYRCILFSNILYSIKLVPSACCNVRCYVVCIGLVWLGPNSTIQIHDNKHTCQITVFQNSDFFPYLKAYDFMCGHVHCQFLVCCIIQVFRANQRCKSDGSIAT